MKGTENESSARNNSYAKRSNSREARFEKNEDENLKNENSIRELKSVDSTEVLLNRSRSQARSQFSSLREHSLTSSLKSLKMSEKDAISKK